MNDNPLFDDEPAPSNATSVHAAPAAPTVTPTTGLLAPGFLKVSGIIIFILCIIAAMTLWNKVENQRMRTDPDYNEHWSYRNRPAHDPYAEHYFPGMLTLLMGSLQGLVIFGLGVAASRPASKA